MGAKPDLAWVCARVGGLLGELIWAVLETFWKREQRAGRSGGHCRGPDRGFEGRRTVLPLFAKGEATEAPRSADESA